MRGIDLVAIEGLEQCCGFGGTFAVKNAEVSSAMLAEKTNAILNTKAEACTACDNSCLMHIQGALHRQRTGGQDGSSGRDSGRGRGGNPMSTTHGTALDPKTAPLFPMAAKAAMGDTQLRKNVRHATNVIQTKRARVVAEMPDWQELREAGKQIRKHTMAHLDFYLQEFERNCTAAGGVVHWARDGAEARQIIVNLVKASGSDEVIKIKSMTTEEIQLNPSLEAAGIHPYETDLAELIIQLGHDQPSHIVVPALHKNRQQIREIFRREMNLPDLGESPQDLADAARRFLRERFLRVKTGVSGANFLIAETGGVAVVESEGNGRMCLTLPETLITVAGIDKIVPRYQDLEVLFQVLPRSATGERMNPYNSIWDRRKSCRWPEGISCRADGQRTHRNPRRRRVTPDALLHSLRRLPERLPVYRQTGGHAYGSVYAGPIGAILTPQLQRCSMHSRCPMRRVCAGPVTRSAGQDQHPRGADPSAQQGGEAERPDETPRPWRCGRWE